MNCPNCQAEIRPKAKFCDECGQSVPSASAESAHEPDVSIGAMPTMIGAKKAPLVVAPSGAENGTRGSAEIAQREVSLGDQRTMAAPAVPYTMGQLVADRYELEAEFGRGGFATVWRARDRKLGRIVALKRLLPEALAGEGGRQTLERFRREAQAVASLNHRNIVAVYDRGEDVAGPYVVMELVEDGNLRSLLKERGKLDLSETLRIARGVALGLDHAHRKNLVHRDIKPANILLRREGDELIPKIADFGLARIGADSGVSLSGYGMGTMAYMPPEQRRDAKNVNHTADIYALGKTLYEMLTGVTPDDVDLEKLPPTYAAIIRRCVRPNPDERYFSVESLLADLDRAASASALAKVDTSAASSTKNPCPACTQENTEDAEFCEGCGTGLMRDCPECGTRNRTVKLFCRKCGTAVESFVKVSESVDRARRYLEDHQFSRVIKETDSLTELSPGLKGPKGRQLLKDAEKLHEQATKLSATRDKKIKDVRQAYEERHGAKLRAAFESLKPLMPKLDADLTSISEEMETIDKENQIAALCSRARAAHQQREANGLAVALNELKFLCPDLPGEMSALAADVENIRYEQSAAPFRKAVEKALADEQPEVAEQVIAKWRTLGREDPEIDQVAVRLHACRRMLLERQVAASLSNVRSALTNDAPDQAEHALADWPAAAAADPRLVAVQSEIEQLRHVLICAADAAALFDEHRYQECIEICHKLLNCGGAARVIKGHQWEGSVTEIIWRATRHVKQAEDLKVEALRARETRDWTTALALSTKLAALAPHDPDAPIIKVEAERRLFADRCCATAQQELRAGNLEAVDQALSAWRRLGLTDDTRLPDIDKMLTAARASAARRKRLKILVVIATFVLFLAITDYLHLFVIPRRQFVSACADIRKSCANGNVLDACEHFEKIQTWRGQDKMLLATVSNEVAQAKTREIATRLEAARSAEASAQWQVCLDQAVAVLAITPDQAEAMALKQEAEGHLAPTLTINATAGGIAVSATISDGTKTWTTPATLKLVPDQVYNFTVFIFTYGGSGGPALPRQYKSAAISLTADWRGAKTQTVTLEEQKGPAEAQLWTIYDLAMTFMPVASGDFQMGSESGDSDEKPVHRVKISRAFWMGKTEVTQKQWQTLMGDNPSKFKGADQPVEQVDWDKCVTFCQKLTQRERAAGRIPAGYEFRLPTEAEWEYAARGGVESRAFAYSGSASLDDVAWSKANSGSKTQPVGQKKPNELGLYDMSGNVWEWCFDLYGNYNTIAVSDPKGSSLGSNRVGRGGGWCNDAPSCRSTFRVWYKPSLVYDGLGFRVVLAPVP